MIIISGAAGFLGSHLAELLLNNGHEVLGVDNFCTSVPNSNHINRLHQHKSFSFMLGDICDTTLSLYKMKGKEIHAIYNFACPASPPLYQKMPIETMMTCVQGTKNMLDLAQQYNCPIIHASTSEVYGDPTISPQPESYRGCVNSYGPRSCYDEGKRAAEALCFDYLHKYKVDARVVRIFNTYGPQMDPNDGRVVSNLICQAIKGEALTIYGDGTQTRSFCYVSDLIDAIVAMGTLEKNPMTPINIGNPDEFTINQLAELINKKLGVKLSYYDLPIDDPKQRKPDITLARDILKWEPKVDLEKGITKTLEYFKSIL